MVSSEWIELGVFPPKGYNWVRCVSRHNTTNPESDSDCVVVAAVVSAVLIQVELVFKRDGHMALFRSG